MMCLVVCGTQDITNPTTDCHSVLLHHFYRHILYGVVVYMSAMSRRCVVGLFSASGRCGQRGAARRGPGRVHAGHAAGGPHAHGLPGAHGGAQPVRHVG